MNELWHAGVPRRDLHHLAAQLGSDVPFALHGGTALGTGRGEQLATVLARSVFHWVFAFADGGLLRAGESAGALAGIVSGSGPTCAFLCTSADDAVQVSAELAGAGVCRTVRVASGPVHGAQVIQGRSDG
ncbi:4-diphosphocytidyl-2-C-methyl-D-erythritol kinase ispE [Mycobacteroides abscessus subsp. abscessus]|nr:4-diphosphocytidyl-2-C-methyl-D-erythritol kinase ispE [Mycobacteroides abscessus subsp. abscessus]